MTGTLASLNRSWQSNKGTVRASGMAGIETMPSQSRTTGYLFGSFAFAQLSISNSVKSYLAWNIRFDTWIQYVSKQELISSNVGLCYPNFALRRVFWYQRTKTETEAADHRRLIPETALDFLPSHCDVYLGSYASSIMLQVLESLFFKQVGRAGLDWTIISKPGYYFYLFFKKCIISIMILLWVN